MMVRCYEDYGTFRRYKEGRFFDKILKGDIEEVNRKKDITKIQQKLELELEK